MQADAGCRVSPHLVLRCGFTITTHMETTLQTRIHFGKARFNQAGKRTTIKSTCPENGVTCSTVLPNRRNLPKTRLSGRSRGLPPGCPLCPRITSGLPVICSMVRRWNSERLERAGGHSLVYNAGGSQFSDSDIPRETDGGRAGTQPVADVLQRIDKTDASEVFDALLP